MALEELQCEPDLRIRGEIDEFVSKSLQLPDGCLESLKFSDKPESGGVLPEFTEQFE